MAAYKELVLFALGLALVGRWEWHRRKRGRRERLLKTLSEVLGTGSN